MRYVLENDILKIEIESVGAELKSAVNKNSGIEYMWYAKPEYWKRTSPILFPFIGDVVDGKYRFDGKEYQTSSHGFARDMEFDLLSSSNDEIWFEIKDNETTYENYPFHFGLKIGYVLKDNALDVIWRVSNPGQERNDETLYFSIGAHPAFNCPINGEESKAGYYLNFGNAEEIIHHGNLKGTCTHEEITLPLDEHKALITEEFFDRSTYIIEDKQVDYIAIETPDGKPYVEVIFDTPLVGVWSPIGGKRAPFICIEPWLGRADYDDFTGDITERDYENSLAKGEELTNTYTIKFN